MVNDRGFDPDFLHPVSENATARFVERNTGLGARPLDSFQQREQPWILAVELNQGLNVASHQVQELGSRSFGKSASVLNHLEIGGRDVFPNRCRTSVGGRKTRLPLDLHFEQLFDRHRAVVA